jgi:hypothetical protein
MSKRCGFDTDVVNSKSSVARVVLGPGHSEFQLSRNVYLVPHLTRNLFLLCTYCALPQYFLQGLRASESLLFSFLISKSISISAQYGTLDNKIKSLRLAFCFGNPTYKTVTGTAYMWGTTNSKPPGPIIMIDQSEILSCS